jgi:hypothetical protein
MGDVGASPVRGAEGTTESPAPTAIPDPVILRFALLTYLVVLPMGHLFTVPINGTWATGSDAFLALALLAGIIDLLRIRGPYRTGGEDFPVLPGRRAFHVAALFILAFSVWVTLSATWSSYPTYAVTKGLAFAALGMGALAILWCGAAWAQAADAWLLGTLICLVVTWVGVLLGPDAFQARLLHEGGSIRGLPMPRVSGPFPHPNMFGDFLVVSGAILWARWDAVREAWGWAAVGAAWLLAGTLVVTVSSAWLGAGVLLTAMGLLTMRQRDGGPSVQLRRPAPVIFVVTGVILFTMTLAGLVLPMSVEVAGLSITGSGIRPVIWGSAMEAFLGAPLGGVGASPVLAVAADPLGSTSSAALWDAHNIYLSILGQFGLVGAALFGGAFAVLARTLVREGTTRRHAVLVVALLAVGVHGVAIANEEFRHLWALLGLVGLAGVPQWAQGQWWKEEGSQE